MDNIFGNFTRQLLPHLIRCFISEPESATLLKNAQILDTLYLTSITKPILKIETILNYLINFNHQFCECPERYESANTFRNIINPLHNHSFVSRIMSASTVSQALYHRTLLEPHGCQTMNNPQQAVQ